jgi:PhnB protein
MARTSTYLNFESETEAAFLFYRAAFGTEFNGPIARMGDVAPVAGMPELSDDEKNLVMHIELPILGGHVLMGTDTPESMGFDLTYGDNVHLNLEPDTREEADRLFAALSEGGEIMMAMQEMPWGAYYGACLDQFGISWMFNVSGES